MIKNLLAVILLSVLLINAATSINIAKGAEPETSAPIAGQWTYASPRTILGEGTDTTIQILQKDGEWTLNYLKVHHPSVNDRDRKPVIMTEGPFPITAEKGILTIKKERPEHYTFKVSKGRLTMPAIIEKEPGKWAYQSADDSFSVECEHNPREIPVGKAQIPGILLGKGFYSYEEAPHSERPNVQYLRFLERTKQGHTTERFRLIFDSYGQPRYERLIGTGQRSHNPYPIIYYLSEAEN